MQYVSLAPNDINVKLETVFDQWKGAEEQVDDALIVGIKMDFKKPLDGISSGLAIIIHTFLK